MSDMEWWQISLATATALGLLHLISYSVGYWAMRGAMKAKKEEAER